MKKGKLAFSAFLIFSLTFFLSGCGPSGPINQSPNASFSANPTSGNAPLQVTFDASNSSDSDGRIISYDWDFGDGTTGSGETVTHTYYSADDYSVSLSVSDSDGAVDTAWKTVSVEPKQELKISINEVYADPGAFEAYDIYLKVDVEGITKRIPGSSSQPDWWEDLSGWEEVSGSESFNIPSGQTIVEVDVDIWDEDTATEDDELAGVTLEYNMDTGEKTRTNEWGTSSADFKATFWTETAN